MGGLQEDERLRRPSGRLEAQVAGEARRGPLAVGTVDRVVLARSLSAEYTNTIRYANGLRTLIPTWGTLEKYYSGELRRKANEGAYHSGYGTIRDSEDRIVKVLSPAVFEDQAFEDEL